MANSIRGKYNVFSPSFTLVLDIGEHNMVVKTHKQIKPNTDFNSIQSNDYFSRVIFDAIIN
ncbi:MAG: hypothetical protein WAL28_06905 [Nitrososphaeraceae archaeon]|nr:hypothetical protein [Nitrososphaeraceae archaeon]MDW0259899.1 hypothetical protein [Nitrososphaeraceae archaeon]MDW0277581.1 hypothetical protein [Nitrososphaeraceae archaeon]MDW0291362.1 hypothetical protein [Nitrososphaeraceae archaeon]